MRWIVGSSIGVKGSTHDTRCTRQRYQRDAIDAARAILPSDSNIDDNNDDNEFPWDELLYLPPVAPGPPTSAVVGAKET